MRSRRVGHDWTTKLPTYDGTFPPEICPISHHHILRQVVLHATPSAMLGEKLSALPKHVVEERVKSLLYTFGSCSTESMGRISCCKPCNLVLSPVKISGRKELYKLQNGWHTIHIVKGNVCVPGCVGACAYVWAAAVFLLILFWGVLFVIWCLRCHRDRIWEWRAGLAGRGEKNPSINVAIFLGSACYLILFSYLKVFPILAIASG